MPYAAALAAVTLNPAKIFGVADRTGSLEPGKDADLVIWTGDPFEPLSQPTAVFIHGQQQPMTSRQLELATATRISGDPCRLGIALGNVRNLLPLSPLAGRGLG